MYLLGIPRTRTQRPAPLSLLRLPPVLLTLAAPLHIQVTLRPILGARPLSGAMGVGSGARRYPLPPQLLLLLQGLLASLVDYSLDPPQTTAILLPMSTPT